MAKMFTLAETRKMSENRLQTEIGKHVKQLEKLGMGHEEACDLLNTIMNLGIALQEKWNELAKSINPKED